MLLAANVLHSETAKMFSLKYETQFSVFVVFDTKTWAWQYKKKDLADFSSKVRLGWKFMEVNCIKNSSNKLYHGTPICAPT